MPQGQMDEFQRSVLALFPIGQRADFQPQELLAQLAHPGGPAVVDVLVFHAEEGRQFQRPAGRDQINGGKIPGGGYSSVTPSRYGPRAREDASDRTLDNCCACGHESCSLTSKTLGSLAKPCAIAASSRRASAYGGSGISVGNSRICCTLPFCADSSAEGIPEAIANRLRPLDGGRTDFRVGHRVDLADLFDGELRVRIGKMDIVEHKIPRHSLDFDCHFAVLLSSVLWAVTEPVKFLARVVNTGRRQRNRPTWRQFSPCVEWAR